MLQTQMVEKMAKDIAQRLTSLKERYSDKKKDL
jgi:hypothetical protein